MVLILIILIHTLLYYLNSTEEKNQDILTSGIISEFSRNNL